MSKHVPSTTEVTEDDEDDYMSMIIAEPILPKTAETYTQKRLRLEREAETRGRPKSKAELADEAAAARETALSTSLLDLNAPNASKSKGLAMMAKMGFKAGSALGRADNTHARAEPVGVEVKSDRGGIGLDSERKRKVREEFEREGKRVKAEEGEYRERVTREREEGRLEGMVGAAMRTAERMDEERAEEEGTSLAVDGESKKRSVSTRPLKQVNVLWRGLVRKREEKERDRRMRYDLQQSLSRLPTYDDEDEDKDDRRALGKDGIQHTLVEDLEEEDAELDAFNQLHPAERLEKLVVHLRNQYNYCFWCKYSYPDKEMDGCPGVTEEDHD